MLLFHSWCYPVRICHAQAIELTSRYHRIDILNKPSNIHESPDSLPEPDDESKTRSLALSAQIKDACQSSNDGRGGLISFSEFMQQALYAPGIGYYSGGLQKFGAAGDFITAPEVSPLFSQCVAKQAADVLKHYESPKLLEFGAGSGVMAAELLLELERLESLPDQYLIMELSAELKQRQRETISNKAPHLLERVVWLEVLPEEPFNGVVVANEVLDAMPVECFRIVADGGVEVLTIGTENEKLVSSYREASEAVVDKVKIIEERLKESLPGGMGESSLPEGYCSEYNPSIKPWLDSIYRVLNQGVVLLIDYGYPVSEYYHEERKTGTLMCHYQHRAHTNPLWYPGLQDITAFVDFTDVAYSAVEAGFDISGYTTQAAFLMASGLDELYQLYATDDPKQQILLAQQIKTLTLPSEMGERFKVMGLSKCFDDPLRGFALQDLRNRL
jgi:SAM-dependent MidA family methyltransferase